MARGKHLFPFRTEQLSLSAPMVLGSQGPGRVGRRRFNVRRAAFGRLVVVKRRVPAWVARRRSVTLATAAPRPCPAGGVLGVVGNGGRWPPTGAVASLGTTCLRRGWRHHGSPPRTEPVAPRRPSHRAGPGQRAGAP